MLWTVFLACYVSAASAGRMQMTRDMEQVQGRRDIATSTSEAALASLFLATGSGALPHPRISQSRRSASTSMLDDFKIGTRGSPLALAQAYETKRLLLENFPDKFSDEESEDKRKIDIKVIKSTGDMILDKPLEQVGGKGVFTKELDIALLNEDVAICVHSMKDVPTDLVEGTVLPCNLVREDTRDVWISSEADHPKDLPDGAAIGTASLRRQAQLQRMARAQGKSVRCENFRGNVQSRMMKIFERPEAVNSTMLALAGIRRMEAAGKPLGRDGKPFDPVILPFEEMLPAVAQGAIGIQCREGDEETLGYLAALNHADTKAAVDCERAFLRGLDGNCKTPIGGQAWIQDGKMHFWGLVLRADGSKHEEIRKTGDASMAAEIGEEAAREVKEKIGDLLDFIGEYAVLEERAKDSLGEADGLGGYKAKTIA